MKNNDLIENNSKEISPKSNSFEAALKSLEAETFALADVLDNSSDTIRLLEKSLVASKTNFVFKKNIYTENPSITKSPEERHLEDPILEIISYYTETWWSLSWEPDEISKSYRLFLISEEKEFCWSETSYHADPDPDPSDPNANYRESIEFKCLVLFKKPLIESKLEVRLRFAKYIVPFMNSFKEELKKYRLSLNNDKSSSFEKEENITLDDLLF